MKWVCALSLAAVTCAQETFSSSPSSCIDLAANPTTGSENPDSSQPCTAANSYDVLFVTGLGSGGQVVTLRSPSDAVNKTLCVFEESASITSLATMPLFVTDSKCSNGASTPTPGWTDNVKAGLNPRGLYIRDSTDTSKVWRVWVTANSGTQIQMEYSLLPDPPTRSPATPTAAPAAPVTPTVSPSRAPSSAPSAGPSAAPTAAPAAQPSRQPSARPSAPPAVGIPPPTASPQRPPTAAPAPAGSPTASPAVSQARQPTAGPTSGPAAIESDGVPLWVVIASVVFGLCWIVACAFWFWQRRRKKAAPSLSQPGFDEAPALSSGGAVREGPEQELDLPAPDHVDGLIARITRLRRQEETARAEAEAAKGQCLQHAEKEAKAKAEQFAEALAALEAEVAALSATADGPTAWEQWALDFSPEPQQLQSPLPPASFRGAKPLREGSDRGRGRAGVKERQMSPAPSSQGGSSLQPAQSAGAPGGSLQPAASSQPGSSLQQPLLATL
eukprot:TRINITY_DN13956_c0_g3_i1.p1 TRINITY_DN13956_c0_g3~~TRINITY_DN13956_c0_g3_i1.p1  ORF type:complete len:501 (+),score=137.23 TRINITY_DN13956_c0_g3_i1:62-1564(+)